MYSEYRREKTKMADRNRKETLVTVPAKLVTDSAGLAFDIGGSVMKLVYRTKEDYEKAKAEKGPSTPSTMRLVSFSRQELDAAIEFIKEKAYITRTPGQDTTVYTTGVGGSQFKQKMDQEIGVKTQVLGEGDCFGFGMIYLLKNLSLQEIVHPFNEPEVAKLLKSMEPGCDGIVQMVKSGAERMLIPGYNAEDVCLEKLLGGILEDFKPKEDPTKPLISDTNDVFPIALVFCGSAFGMSKLRADGYYTSMDMQGRGGRSLMAMAYAFLGCKNYEEFLSLAEAGNTDNVDYCISDMMGEMMGDAAGEEDTGDTPQVMPKDTSKDTPKDMYSALGESQEDQYNNPLYLLGKLVGFSPGDYNRADVARALLKYMCNDLAQMVDTSLRQAENSDVTRVFFLGSFQSNDLTRSMLTSELLHKACITATISAKRRPYSFYFVKNGAHMGSLGALINTTEQFS